MGSLAVSSLAVSSSVAGSSSATSSECATSQSEYTNLHNNIGSLLKPSMSILT